jgi:uncharacterized glyoxalase superfamily protein PhnB
MIENRSKPGGSVIPSLIYRDVPEAAEWLCRVFGFRQRLNAGTHAQLTIGEGGVLLGQARVEADGTEYRPPRPGECNCQLYEHARREGARIVQPPTTHPYGERRHSADDLDQSSLIIYTIIISSILYFQRNTTGAALISSKY